MPGTSDRAANPSDATGPSATGCRAARRVSVEPSGPVLVEGPVEILLDDGTLARSDRFTVAVCTCRRSRTYPWCDTSHRPRERAAPPEGGHADGGPR
ncbi:CDGSH iron-sulfur domain-containing protein [Streptomyces sp. NPDC058611]|uniref:CDGSH iron-sulfur domain-containing protein n=1 Tax=unclassified Streptomyces TaxID=2593676 RepID=UPI00366618C0